MRVPCMLVLAGLLAVLLAAAPRAGEAARVKLNSIRTVILRDAYAHDGDHVPVNRSAARLPSLTSDLHQFYQCISDLECSEGSFCHAPSRRHAYSRCQTCRRRKRRCHRDGMCCPGNRCSNNICVPDLDSFLSQRLPEEDGGMGKKKGGRRAGGRAASKQSTIKGQVGDSCLRSSDCSEGLCCARHFWARICKPVLREGQVCTRQHQRHRKGPQRGLELFQRCDCGEGLSCRALREPSPPGPEDGPHAPPSSLSSTLLAAASKSSKLSPPSHASGRLFAAKVYPPSGPSSTLLAAASKSLKLSSAAAAGSSPAVVVSRHSAPHSSQLTASSSASSSSSTSSSSSAKARLHLCQRN